MLLFVNLQIVVTKCGVEIGIQSAKAQDAGKEADYYKCEDDLGKGYPEVYYSIVPCEGFVVTPYQCKYCGCKNLEANQIASHEAACSKKSQDNAADYEEIIRGLIDLGGSALGSLGALGNSSDPFLGETLSALGKYAPKMTGLSYAITGVGCAYDVAKGVLKDINGGEKNGYNTVKALGGDLGAYAGSSLGTAFGVPIGAAIGGGTPTAASGGAVIEITCPAGAVLGGAVGGCAFSYFYGKLGKDIGEKIVDKIYDK
ncbi:MAG: hypothetical protein K5874_09425 [Bacteroidaceae bacterium]|nr:hypothetical protein [Bacteroidaceae bacterium]